VSNDPTYPPLEGREMEEIGAKNTSPILSCRRGKWRRT